MERQNPVVFCDGLWTRARYVRAAAKSAFDCPLKRVEGLASGDRKARRICQMEFVKFGATDGEGSLLMSRGERKDKGTRGGFPIQPCIAAAGLCRVCAQVVVTWSWFAVQLGGERVIYRSWSSLC